MAEEIDYTKIRLPCPDCTGELVARQNKENGSRFLGCTNWPVCSKTQPIPLYYVLRAQGAQVLPGFE
jgi:ssDNA-binding Zn-finger/Zn-ribbon topoisomerase 1